MSIPYWDDSLADAYAWNTLKLANFTFAPPLFVCYPVNSPSCAQDYKTNKGVGDSGGYPVLTGKKVADVVFDIEFSSKEALKIWEDACKQFNPDTHLKNQPIYAVYHPTLDLIKLNSVVVVEIVPGFPNRETKIMTGKIKMLSAKKRKAKSVRPKKTAASISRPTAFDTPPNAPQDKISKLAEQNKQPSQLIK